MAKDESFDITTGCDLQEIDNALNQVRREITGRFDFKGVLAEIETDRAAGTITIHTESQFKLDAIWDVMHSRMVARKVPVKNLQRGEAQPAASNTVRQTVKLVQGIESDTAKKIVKFIRDQKLKGVQSQIQGDAVRVSGPKRDDLQAAMEALRGEDWGIELNFGNYR